MSKAKSKAPAGAFDPSRIKRKPVQLPVMRFEDETERFLRIDTPFTKSTRNAAQAAAREDGKKGKAAAQMDPATICTVTDVQTGEQGTLIVNATLQSTIEEKYPSEAYVGVVFGITRPRQGKAKRYYKFSVFEIES